MSGRRKWATVIGFVVLVVAVVAITTSSGLVTRASAIENIVTRIDSGPAWETQQQSNAVGGYLEWKKTGNGNDGAGGCAYVNGRNAKAGFACYLQASEANGGGNCYFREDSSGGNIRPISVSVYSLLTGGS